MQEDKYTILIVDDNELNRDMLSRRVSQQGHDFIMAGDGQQALDLLTQHRIDLILLDLMMPIKDGYATLEEIKSNPGMAHIPVIMVSALDEMDSVVKCIELGADDYLNKPFNPVLLKARISSSLSKKKLHDKEEEFKTHILEYNNRLEEKVKEQVGQISEGHLSAIFAMSKLAESRDPETGSHLERIREYCRILAQDLSMHEYRDEISEEFIETIYIASPLHDIGKVGIGDAVLLKPGKLNNDEWKIMQTHTEIGAETLRAIKLRHEGNSFISMGIEIAESHHEKWAGGGYPHNLKNRDIPLSARILALADVYDALTSVRCYKNAMSHEASAQIIVRDSGKHFDPFVADSFKRLSASFVRIHKEFRG